MPSYCMVSRPGHPLCAPGTTHGILAEHRVVLFEKIGPGAHPCYHCGTPVVWLPGNGPGAPGALTTDHLNRDKTDNRPANLVPCCWPCNSLNSERAIRPDELRLRNGSTATRGVVKRCEYPPCSRPFETVPSKRRKCCSQLCGQRLRRMNEATMVSSGTA